MLGTLLVRAVSGAACELPFALSTPCSYDGVHPSRCRLVLVPRENEQARALGYGSFHTVSHTVCIIGVPNPCANQPLLQGRPGNEIPAQAPRAGSTRGSLTTNLPTLDPTAGSTKLPAWSTGTTLLRRPRALKPAWRTGAPQWRTAVAAMMLLITFYGTIRS